MFKEKFSNASESVSRPSTPEHVWKYNVGKHRAGNGLGKRAPYHLELTNASARVLNFTKAAFRSPPISFATLAAKGKPEGKHFQGEASSLCQSACSSSSPHRRFPSENPGTGTARLLSRKRDCREQEQGKTSCPTHTAHHPS